MKLARILGVTIDWLIQGTTETKSYVAREDAPDYGNKVREVRVVSWTHAGQAAAYEELPTDWQTKVATTSTDPRAFAVTVEGDSMEPKFFTGDRVICEPSREPVNGKIVVAKLKTDGVVLRVFHRLPGNKIKLTSLRPEIYVPVECSTSDLDWVFPVRELIRSV